MSPTRDDLLPSRARTLEHALEIWSAGKRSLLFTGEPGVGKTLLAASFAERAAPAVPPVRVHLAPALDALTFFALIEETLDPDRSGDAAGARLRVRKSMLARRIRSFAPLLIVEGLHWLNREIAAELEEWIDLSLAGEGFAGVVFTARTQPLEGLSPAEWKGVERRIRARLHLGELSGEEARLLIDLRLQKSGLSSFDIDRFYAQSRGNPSDLLRLGEEVVLARRERIAPADSARGGPAALEGEPSPWSIRPLVEEEGVVEIGFEGETDTSASPGETDLDGGVLEGPDPERSQSAQTLEQELRAWDDWVWNSDLGRSAPASGQELEVELRGESIEPAGRVGEPARTSSRIRIDAVEPASPYGKLFGGMRDSGRPAS